MDDFYTYVYTFGPYDGAIFLDATDANGKITARVVPADFEVLVNTVYLADAGYVWYTTNYERDDGVADPKLYDSGVSIIRNLGLGSAHTVTIGLIPAS